MPTAETTLLPAYSATSKRSLTSSAPLDNEPKSAAHRRSIPIALTIFITIRTNKMFDSRCTTVK
jgi:hypothetical protein